MVGIGDYIVLNLLWIVWCAMHSALISLTVINFMQKKFGRKYAFCRLFYVLFSIVTLFVLYRFQVSLQQSVLFLWHGNWVYLRGIMVCYALTCIIGGYFAFDVQYVLGLRQIRRYMNHKDKRTMNFLTKGILQYVRHPWYAAGLLLVWAGGTITNVNIYARFILTMYLIVGTYLEEQKLVVEIGEPYKKYQKVVPMYFPSTVFSRRQNI